MSETIQFDDFLKVEMRVGLITEVQVPEWSEKLLQFTVDFGGEIGQKTIFSGVKKWYTESDFLSKKFPFVVNLAPRKMGPSVSEGMMMMVDNQDKPLLINLADDAEIGAVLC